LLEGAPDVLEAVVGLGALENRQYELVPGDPQPGDEAFVSICARRPGDSPLRRCRFKSGGKVLLIEALAGVVAASGAHC